MENATKALLIAAAVLVAIIIISLTLAIVRQGQEAVGNADLSEAEAAQFNSKFTVYEGTSKSTSEVNALLTAVYAHNNQERAAGTNRLVAVTGSATINTNSASDSASTSVPRISGSAYYKVTCHYNGTIINSISISSANSN